MRSSSSSSRTFALAAVLLLALVASASAVFDWAEMSNMSSKQTGDATFYGHDPDQVRGVGERERERRKKRREG
jgi:hypothetical protein